MQRLVIVGGGIVGITIAIEIALRIEGIRGRTAFLTPAQALLYFVKK